MTFKRVSLDLDVMPPKLEEVTDKRRGTDEKRAAAESSLLEFAKQGWHVLEPGRLFVEGWHIVLICLHLEAVWAGLIKRLMINMPPRHMKSLLVSVFFPLWVWLKDPTKRFFCVSYEMPLSLDLAVKMRRLIDSDWFQSQWGHRVRILPDKDAKGDFENSATGYRYSTSIDAGGTGRGADIGIIDDPHNTKKVESDLKRRSAHNFYHGVFNTRGNDPKTFAMIVVAQRTHEDDLCGHIIDTERGEWDQLVLPARADLDGRSTVLGPYDPRTKIGELLWAARFSESDIAKLARALGPYREAAQLDQKPSPPGGGLFKRSYFIIEAEAPIAFERVRAWDIAATEDTGDNDPDYSCGGIVGRDREDHWWVTDVVKERVDDTEGLIVQTAMLDGDEIPIVVELQPSAAGKLWARNLKDRLNKLGYEVRFYAASGSKVTRASSWAGTAKADGIRLVDAEWTSELLSVVTKFWHGKHDDEVDMISLGYEAILTDGGSWSSGGGVSNDDLGKLPGLRAGGRR